MIVKDGDEPRAKAPDRSNAFKLKSFGDSGYWESLQRESSSSSSDRNGMRSKSSEFNSNSNRTNESSNSSNSNKISDECADDGCAASSFLGCEFSAEQPVMAMWGDSWLGAKIVHILRSGDDGEWQFTVALRTRSKGECDPVQRVSCDCTITHHCLQTSSSSILTPRLDLGCQS